ncbi:replication-relaxation family protein [Streptomyces sp. NPDC021224]|uniref:replication-relaxation family protein n=1 Tax=unclassified Streptomyces TaxID=2593676 RepID=UPI00379F40BB
MITKPTPQRALRAHRPPRPTPRAAATGEYIARLASRLTARDRWVARMLHEHKVLTSTQLAAMAWPSQRVANMRLRELFTWRVVDRFQPYAPSGSAPMHYVLDAAGAAILAHEDGLDPRDLGYRHERAIGIAHSLRLAHTVGTNEVFTTLIACARRGGSGQLTTWWSEARCARHFGDIVRPDAYARWQEASSTVEWFLEYDLATERPDRVAAKLPAYAKLATTTGITTPLLLWLPTARREAAVRRALTAALAELDQPARLPVATASADHLAVDGNPAGEHWLPLQAHRPAPGRLRLAGLLAAWPQVTPVGSGGVAAPGPSGLLPPSPTPPPASVRTGG